MDARWFWEQLEVDPDALAEVAGFLAECREEFCDQAGREEGSFLLMVMEFGARLALRMTPGELASGRKNADRDD